MIQRTTWILLIIFVILLATLFGWQWYQNTKAPQVTPTLASSSFLGNEGASISVLKIANAQGKSVEVKQDLEGNWLLVEPTGYMADEARIQSAVDALSGMRLVDTIDKPPALNVMGLDPAKYRVAVIFSGGEELVVFIGEPTPTRGGYYAYQDGKPVVVVDSFAVEGMLDIFNGLPILVTPTPTYSEIGTSTLPTTQTPQTSGTPTP